MRGLESETSSPVSLMSQRDDAKQRDRTALKARPDGEVASAAMQASLCQGAGQSAASYPVLWEAAPDAMVVLNEDGTIVLVNAQTEKQFGYGRDELLGEKLTRIFTQGCADRPDPDASHFDTDALARQIGTGIELWGHRKDCSVFPIEIMLSPHSDSGEMLMIAAIRDISARKHAEVMLQKKITELSRSNDDLAHFAAVASHDLQEPLRMVSSYTQLLARRYKGKLDDDADEFIGFAVDGAHRMQRLIQDLLAFSRVGSTGNDLVTSSACALRLALHNLSSAIAESKAVITHDALPDVRADTNQLVQLFQNLVGNAIKYQGAGIPHVHVSAAPDDTGNRWRFAITDNGLGIEAQYFEKIFGMFQRLHKREEYSGTGIGLAICKKIVDRHGGTISVESRLGQGSTFRFDLAASTETCRKTGANACQAKSCWWRTAPVTSG